MGREGAVRVEALGQLDPADAGEVGLVLADVDDRGLGNVLGHGDRLERAEALVVDPLLEVGDGNVEQRRELGEDLVAVLAELLAADDDGVRHLVVDDHPPLPVEDPPSWSLGVDRAHPVDVGLDAVGRTGEDLQVPEARQQGGEQGHDDDPDNAQPQPGRLQRHG